MYNYIMLIMGAIDEDRQKEYQNQQGTKSKQQLKREQNISTFQKLIGEDSNSKLGTGKKMITIEVTPEDMANAKKEKEERQKAIKERKLPSRVKPSSSSSRK